MMEETVKNSSNSEITISDSIQASNKVMIKIMIVFLK